MNPRSAGFWQAAWVTSTLFGFGHTGNNGENWIGIFAAAFIGFVFCVSVWVTGSAWWAIGCHAAWDWAETYFYGTADSGFVAPGHLLSTSPAGNPLWSGGTDGPEGSLLIIPIVLLILAWLLVVYRRPRPAEIRRARPQRSSWQAEREPMRLWLNRTGEVSLREQLITQVVLGILCHELAPGPAPAQHTRSLAPLRHPRQHRQRRLSRA